MTADAIVPRLTPGPALDALLAEKVMGWKWCHRIGDTPGYTWLVYPDFPIGWVVGTYPVGPMEHVQRPEKFQDESTFLVPRYSTSIAAAWEVVEHMIRGSENLRFDRSYEFYLSRQADGYECVFAHPAKPRGVANAPTAPHAICVAALRAFGTET